MYVADALPYTPFLPDTPSHIVPVSGMIFIATIVLASIFSRIHERRLKARQRLAMLDKGLKPDEIVAVLGNADDDPIRSLARGRRKGTILCALAVGLILFFVALAKIQGERDILSGAAAAIVPLAIGIGFFVDYAWHKRDLARLGVDLDAKP